MGNQNKYIYEITWKTQWIFYVDLPTFAVLKIIIRNKFMLEKYSAN